MTKYLLLGATGDLATKKITPALAALFLAGKFGSDFTFVASSRRDWSDEEYRAFIRPHLLEHGITPKDTESFLHHARYFKLDLDQAAGTSLLPFDTNASDQTIVHLAIYPSDYVRATERLAALGIVRRMPSTKLLIEKPFGKDEPSAQALEQDLLKHVDESQIYRVDHYLGKDAVRELAISSEAKNNPGLRALTLTLYEKDGVETRGAFYDAVGVLNDVVQNHLLEMLAFALGATTPEARGEILANILLDASAPASLRQGQYEGYAAIPGVANGSQTPTWIEFALCAGSIAVRLRAGKAMPESMVSVEYAFADGTKQTRIIQKSGLSPNPYALLICEALASDHTFFVSMPEVKAAWHLIDQVAAKLPNQPLIPYAPGTKPR